MADNYTLFSFAIKLEGDKEREWAKRACKFLNNPEDYMDEDGEIDEESEFYSILPDDVMYGCSTTFAVDGPDLWIYSEGSGAPDDCVPLVSAYLLKFHPDRVVCFEWANTCSKPRLDEFGGGAVCVSAYSAEYMPTHLWWEAATAKLLAEAASASHE